MRIPILTFGAIASFLTLNAFADSKTLTTQGYVDAQDALKQDLITTEMLEIFGKSGTTYLPTLVSYDSTDGLLGNQIGIYQTGTMEAVPADSRANIVPSVAVVWDDLQTLSSFKQDKIPKSGYMSTGNIGPFYSGSGIASNDWLNAGVKGTGLVTRTSEDGKVGERKIFEASDFSGYHATGLTQNEKDIQDISIPTVGAMMTAISNNHVTLPTGTAGNVVTYNSNGAIGGSVATYNGSTTYNASTDASKIAVMSAVQRKKTCARYVQNADQTAENCLLWNLPD